MSDEPRATTWDDLLAFPEDNQKREIIGGELFLWPSPTVWHQQVVANIGVRLADLARNNAAGKAMFLPMDVRLAQYDSVQPDVFYIRPERFRALLAPDDRFTGAPDLVAEVLAPESRFIDRVRKLALYAAVGVPEYWLIDPDARTTEGFALVNGRYLPLPPDAAGRIASCVLPELVVDPVWVFAELDD